MLSPSGHHLPVNQGSPPNECCVHCQTHNDSSFGSPKPDVEIANVNPHPPETTENRAADESSRLSHASDDSQPGLRIRKGPENCALSETVAPPSTSLSLPDFATPFTPNLYEDFLFTSSLGSPDQLNPTEHASVGFGSEEPIVNLPTPTSPGNNNSTSYEANPADSPRRAGGVPLDVSCIKPRVRSKPQPVKLITTSPQSDSQETRVFSKARCHSSSWPARQNLGGYNIRALTTPTAVMRRGKTALHLCSERGNTKAVQLLLNRGANIDCLDGLGRTALHYATRVQNLELMAMLLEKGADTEIVDCEGMSALHVAADLGSECMIRLLIQEGADLHAKIETGSGDYKDPAVTTCN